MNWLDLFILLFLVTALVRGSEVGFIRQFFSALGFFIGLFIGAWLHGLVANLAHAPNSKAILALTVTLGFALIFMVLGEYIGLLVKFRLREARITNKVDRLFGAVIAAITLLAVVWFGSAIFRTIPDSGWQRQIRTSRVVTFLDSKLPSAPELLTSLGHLIDPNGFPQVFTGLEPTLEIDTPLPDMGELNPAVQAARPSVVKLEGEGCDNIVEGSGFVAGTDEIVTNAHVVAGVKSPFVLDAAGRHRAKVVLFDPDLDLAILRSSGLAGKPLPLNGDKVPNGTATAILGFPAGAGFTAGPGVILESFTAMGRNIYNQGNTERQIYSVKADVQQGNSGGPLINKSGQVVGVIFAKSVNYDHVGYALTMDQVIAKLNQAQGKETAVSTSSCTD